MKKRGRECRLKAWKACNTDDELRKFYVEEHMRSDRQTVPGNSHGSAGL